MSDNILTEEHRKYLEALRDSGVTNMLGAAPYIQEQFSVDEKTAGKILIAWIESFNENS